MCGRLLFANPVTFLKLHISGMLEEILLKFGCGLLMVEGVYTAKIILFHKGSTELRMHIFFLPVNILTVLSAGFLGHTTHYRVS